MKKFDLTKGEKDVLEVMWKEGRPLSVLEIIRITADDLSWSSSRVLAIINSLTKKELVESVGFVKNHKSFARTFSPTISFEEHTVNQIKSSSSFSQGSISKIFSGLLNSKATVKDKQKTIEELRVIIEENLQEEDVKNNPEDNDERK